MEILTIENKAGKVRLNESVNPDSMSRLIDEIGLVFGAKAFADGAVTGEITNCIENAADTLDLEIHSPGGSVLDGYKLYHALLDLRGRGVYVTATINSLAASMASVIAMAADKIRMVKGGRMMIHDAQTGAQAVYGNAKDLRKQAEEISKRADMIDEISDEIAAIYSDRTGQEVTDMRELMLNETWVGADEALKRNFIDEIAGGKFDTKDKGKSMNILDRLTSPASAEALAEIDTLKSEVSNRESELAELTNKVSVAEAALQEAATATAELRNSYATAQAEIETLKAEVAKIPNLEAAAAVSREKIANEASTLAASIGLPTALDDSGTGESSKTPHLDTFNTLTGAEKSAYYQANGNAIRKEMSL